MTQTPLSVPLPLPPWGGEGQIFFKIYGLVLEYSDAMWLTFQPCNLHTQYTQSMNFNGTHTRVHRSLKGPEN